MIELDVEHLNWKYPKYPVTVSDKGWVYGVWYCSTAWMKTHFHGQYPLTFLKRALALFPKAERVLHCPSGTLTGPGMTVDLVRDAQRRPQVQASADNLPFKMHTFDLYISDPPYSDPDSGIYGCAPFPMKGAMREAHRVVEPGGFYCLLHFWYPSFRERDWKMRGLISVVTGANRHPRLFTIFQRAMVVVCAASAGCDEARNPEHALQAAYFLPRLGADSRWRAFQ